MGCAVCTESTVIWTKPKKDKKEATTHTHTHINDILMSCTNLAITYSKKRRLNRATGDKIDENEKNWQHRIISKMCMYISDMIHGK